jgi:sensor histidine kinase YesM
MTIAFLVPISSLPLFLLACFLWGLGDYLITMLAWFFGALILVVVPFAVCAAYVGAPPITYLFSSLIFLISAPFVGLYVRDKREQREEPEKERQKALREQRREQERQQQEALKEQKAKEWWLLSRLEWELSEHKPLTPVDP